MRLNKNTFPAAVLALAALAAGGCTDPCENDKIQTRDSPDGSKRAIVFRRRCDPKTECTMNVSVIPMPGPKDPSPTEGNALILEGEAHIALRWVDAAHLTVMAPGQVRATRREPLVNGVSITYNRND